MFRVVRSGFVAVLILIFLSGCNLIHQIETSAQAAKDAGSILFYDDFSDSGSGWRQWSSPEAVIHYQDGVLAFLINQANYDYWSLAGKNYTDVTLAVEAELINGPTDNDFGLICRFQDEYNFYAFLISSDGYGGIVKVKDGLYQVLSSPNGLEFGKMITQGYARNQLRADCVCSRLTLFVNQQKFAEVEDPDFSMGDVGLLAGAYQMPGVEVHFDNFYVIKP
ncbi:MAG TPA: hypothetical protein DCE76_10665 [Anaerolineaceae bacterium]|nr:hypothetical protein [Anaerolineaceae bacterium]